MIRMTYRLALVALIFLALALVPWVRTVSDAAVAAWGPDVRLTNDPGYSATWMSTQTVASAGDHVHAAWRDNRDGNEEIYYKGSADGGATWGSDVRLTNEPKSSSNPAVAVSGDHVHVAWQDGRTQTQWGWYCSEIFYKRSVDNGATWSDDIRVSYSGYGADDPAIAAAGDNVYVVWMDRRQSNGYADRIYIRISTDGGASWGPETILVNHSRVDQPHVAAFANAVHAVWEDGRDGGEWEVYYNRSTDGGATWSGDTRLTNNADREHEPRVAATADTVHVVWEDYRDWHDIYYIGSLDGGTTWSSEKLMTADGLPDGSSGQTMSIAAVGSLVHLVWGDARIPDRSEVYYVGSTDCGVSWGTEVRLTDVDSYSVYPSVSSQDGVVHVVWEETRDGNNEIYYKRFESAESDGDGIANAVEDAAPNEGDANGDGTPDSLQANVSSLLDAAGSDYVTLTAPVGTQLGEIVATDTAAVGSAPPEDLEFPSGLVAFALGNMPPPPSSLDVALTFANAACVNQYWRHGPEPEEPADHWYRFDPVSGTPPTGASLAGVPCATGATLTLVDGERGDDDLTVDGTVVDVGGAARPPIDRGDCNADIGVNAGDLSALILEIFDADGSDPDETPGGTFCGHPIGCNANADGAVDAGDLSCTILMIFNGPGSCD